MENLSTLLTTPPLVDGATTVEIPAGWEQGRGAYGGLVLGLMTAAAAAAVDDSARRLRSLTGELFGPVSAGPARVEVEVLRVGSAVSTVAVRLRQAEPLATAVAVFGRPRADTTRWQELTPPALTPWREVPPIPANLPMMPTFTQHFEFRNTGPLPFSGAGKPHAEGWIRTRVPPLRCDDAWLIALADCWWPAILPAEPDPRAMATIGFTLQVVGSTVGLEPDAPLYHRGYVLAGEEGYLVEQRELWSADGRLLALNPQTFVLIR